MKRNIYETKVSQVLHAGLEWVHKPIDGPHGGQVKLDFYGLDFDGHFVAVEVKRTANQDFYNPNTKGSSGISAAQRAELDKLAEIPNTHVFVVVGSDRAGLLYVFPWRDYRHDDRWLFGLAPNRFGTPDKTSVRRWAGHYGV